MKAVQLQLQSAAAPDDGVESLYFALVGQAKAVAISAHMNPDDEVIDADEGDFPQFDAVISIEEYRKLRQMFIDFNPGE